MEDTDLLKSITDEKNTKSVALNIDLLAVITSGSSVVATGGAITDLKGKKVTIVLALKDAFKDGLGEVEEGCDREFLFLENMTKKMEHLI